MPAPPTSAALTLQLLASALGRVGASVRGDASVCIVDVRQDSRQIQPGDLFVARAGGRASGADYVHHALQRGARAVMVERGTQLSGVTCPVVEVDDVRLALALAAEVAHDHPSQSLQVVGITGTNGKTTTAWLAQQAVIGAGGRAARLGTLGYAFEGDQVDSALTTPEADVLARYAGRCRDAGGTHLLMEVSSHALAQRRVDAIRFQVAVLTNLTQDLLDYHQSIDAYAAAKARLFLTLQPAVAVINVDDRFGQSLAERVNARVLRVSRSERGDVRPQQVTCNAAGIRGKFVLPSGTVELSSQLVGDHNLDNLLTTMAVVEALGLDARRAAQALSEAAAIPGRLERCDGPGDDVLVLVDYAHTPDALRRALQAVQALTQGSVLCVFGCGGDRAPYKRPRMGSAVGAAASFAIVSNDNPRSEDPRRIVEQIEPGLRAHGIAYEVQLDRAPAK